METRDVLEVRNHMAAIVQRIATGDTLAVIEAQELIDAVRRRLDDDGRDPMVSVTLASLVQLEQLLTVLYGANDPATVPTYVAEVASAYDGNGGRRVSHLAGHVVVQLDPAADRRLALAND